MDARAERTQPCLQITIHGRRYHLRGIAQYEKWGYLGLRRVPVLRDCGRWYSCMGVTALLWEDRRRRRSRDGSYVSETNGAYVAGCQGPKTARFVPREKEKRQQRISQSTQRRDDEWARRKPFSLNIFLLPHVKEKPQ